MLRTPPQRGVNVQRTLPPPKPISTASPSTLPAATAVTSLENHVAHFAERVKKAEEHRDQLLDELAQTKEELRITKETSLLLRGQLKVETTEKKVEAIAVSFRLSAKGLGTRTNMVHDVVSRILSTPSFSDAMSVSFRAYIQRSTLARAQADQSGFGCSGSPIELIQDSRARARSTDSGVRCMVHSTIDK